jgi:hypothetical protein
MENINLNEMIDNKVSTKWENLIIKGNTYKNFATLIVIATRGTSKTRAKCPKCEECFEVEHWAGFHPWIVESWKRLLKPMNVPILEMIISGHEVGEAYNQAIEQLLTNPGLKDFKYVLFMEDDVIIPFIQDSFGPLIELYKHLETYDVASGLYWTKSEPSLPLVYGSGDIDDPIPFGVNLNWNAGDVVNVNGTGMGFTLMKRSIFEDPKLEKPFFKTLNEVVPGGARLMTQDLYFYHNIKKLGYKICVDTSIKCGHLDLATETVY